MAAPKAPRRTYEKPENLDIYVPNAKAKIDAIDALYTKEIESQRRRQE